MIVRVSATDWVDDRRSWTADDTVRLAGVLREHGVSLVDTSTGAITLAATPDGPALDLDGTHRSGTHRLGRIEVDLVAGFGTTEHALFADLTGTCSADCGRLLAPSGQPLTTVAAVAGDGRSTATATGGTRAIADFDHPDASVDGTPSVRATVFASAPSAGVAMRTASPGRWVKPSPGAPRSLAGEKGVPRNSTAPSGY